MILLKGDVGIFKGEEEYRKKIESGEKRGVSLTISQLRGISEQEWNDNEATIRVEVPAAERRSLDQLLQHHSFEYRLKIKKSAIGSAVFEFTSANKEGIIRLLELVILYYFGKKVDEINIDFPDISLLKSDTDIDFDINILFKRTIQRVSSEYGGE